MDKSYIIIKIKIFNKLFLPIIINLNKIILMIINDY